MASILLYSTVYGIAQTIAVAWTFVAVHATARNVNRHVLPAHIALMARHSGLQQYSTSRRTRCRFAQFVSYASSIGVGFTHASGVVRVCVADGGPGYRLWFTRDCLVPGRGCIEHQPGSAVYDSDQVHGMAGRISQCSISNEPKTEKRGLMSPTLHNARLAPHVRLASSLHIIACR